jgi:cell division septation protein DedD
MLPLDSPGFVLQVGAMGQEGNADALSNELRKKNFSAFVFHRGTDPFYRVAVGPYTDEPAAIRIQKDLEQEGYKPILKPWSPQ